MGKKKKAEAGLDPLPPLGMWKERCGERKNSFSHMDEAMPEVRQ